ncbi:Hsp20/alpha crystallin family protein [Geoalkalibacter sp.]|uniref:Hsp20/alpha crystallin family protein n=1 Tax=Geoalkalibacter sp. TaxID=3041440 RepID=UPI00272ED706|nr:Hsp20/alpha crystallin family protein [Geoalkalibacter sp.]
MAAEKTNPFAEFQDIQKLMVRIFDRTSSLEPGEEGRAGSWNPPVDVFEDAEAVVLIMDLPGVAEKDLELECGEDVLVIRGTRPAAETLPGRQYQRMERPQGSFCRTFALPDRVDRTRVQARCHLGELTLILPKRPCASPGPAALSES